MTPHALGTAPVSQHSWQAPAYGTLIASLGSIQGIVVVNAAGCNAGLRGCSWLGLLFCMYVATWVTTL